MKQTTNNLRLSNIQGIMKGKFLICSKAKEQILLSHIVKSETDKRTNNCL